MPVPYFHVVYTLPATIRDIAYQNKAVIYHLLLRPRPRPRSRSQLIASVSGRIGFMWVLQAWGSA